MPQLTRLGDTDARRTSRRRQEGINGTPALDKPFPGSPLASEVANAAVCLDSRVTNSCQP